MKFWHLILLALLTFGVIAPSIVWAWGGHHESVVNNYYEENHYDSNINRNDLESVMAASMAAAAIDCSVSSRKHQMGIGAGYQGGENAGALGYCHSVSNSNSYAATLGVKSSFATGMKPAFGVGYNFAW